MTTLRVLGCALLVVALVSALMAFYGEPFCHGGYLAEDGLCAWE